LGQNDDLDQEIRDASEQLKQSKDSLAAIIAREKLAKEKCNNLKKSIEEHEGYAIKALGQDNESLAHEVAEKIADFEDQLALEQDSASGFADSANNLRTAISQTESNLRRLKQQVDTVKATENVQRAQEAVAERHSGSNSKLRTAMDSLERIKEKQALKAATMSAASDLANDSIDSSLTAKLEEAGISPTGKNADDILEKLKKKAVKKSKMDPFYQNVLSFPTVFFSIILVFCILFWLVAILGFLEISFLDIPEPEFDLGGDTDVPSTPDAVAGIILKLGLNGVPFTVIITLITLLGWFISYYIVHLTADYIPGGIIYYLVGLVILVVAIYIAALITAKIIKPLRPLFKSMEQDVEKLVMGQVAIVRTSRVDNNFGEATLEDGGAGLILKIRSSEENNYKQGDRVVLIEYNKELNVFRVVSEEEFKGM